jgi:hypothetical protein
MFFLQMLDIWPFVEDPLQALQPCCSLEELLHHQEKLIGLQQLVLEGKDQTGILSIEGCMAPLKVQLFIGNFLTNNGLTTTSVKTS